MYYIGFCPSCEQGTLGIRICSSLQDLVILCDECDALWLTPETSVSPHFPQQPALPCPACEGNLTAPPAHWAELGELFERGWLAYIKGEAD
ncbi:hypothetical protein Enr10x_57960 [Gimesia panareensis]|uniref:Uncharacterized protein n=1 Tax=Gimesia panareensis TaxID=2527978 RepID=A0A517QFK9_9PLAN|nr:hypothetical protein [Gimesia panareensis]QDT30430.1 hypothetical protein Enr10x_57960 [Gimesia panareensis]